MDEQTFWLRLWKVVFAALVVIVATAAGCSVHEARVTAGLIQSGTPPADARCAISNSPPKEVCAIRAARP